MYRISVLAAAAFTLAACASSMPEPVSAPPPPSQSAPAPEPVAAPAPPPPAPMPAPTQRDDAAMAEAEVMAREAEAREAAAREEAERARAEAEQRYREAARQEAERQQARMAQAEEDVTITDLVDGDACINSAGYGSSYDCVDLFFGTNREEQPSASGQIVFGPRAETRTQLGTVTVTVPIARLDMPGSPVKKLSNPNRTVSEADRNEFFAIWGWEPQDEGSFGRLVRQELLAAEDFENSALVFVHGFNVTFRSAAFRAAQMKFDMAYDGPVFFFSWPANGSTLEYLSDQDDADISVAPLTEFLKLVDESVGEETKIYLVAHSMGTRLAAQAINRLSLDPAYANEDPFFERSLFAAGDLDRALFRRWIEPARGKVGELTIYTSSDDKAVQFSRFLRTPGFGLSGSEDERSRIGLVDADLGPSIFDDAMTIDITDVNTGLLSNFFGVNHADYVESAVTIADLEALLRGAAHQPDRRNENFVRRCYNGKPYWKYIEGGGVPETGCRR